MRKFLACSVVGVTVFGGALVACGGDGDGGSEQAFCDEFKKDVEFFDNLSDQSDVDESQSESLATEALVNLANKAPSEIKSDMQKLAQFEKDSAEGKDSDVSTTDLATASANVTKFAEEKCGIDLDSGLSSLTDDLSDLTSDFSDLSDLSDLTSDFSDFSDLSDLTSDFSDFSDFSGFSDFDSVFSDLDSLFSS